MDGGDPGLNPVLNPVRLSASDARTWLRKGAFTTNVPGRVGVEIEYLPQDADGRPSNAAALARFDRSDLPANGRITAEPGGQLEVSTRACDGLVDAVTAAAIDVSELRRRAELAGVDLVGQGTSPVHLPDRHTDHPRYRAMEQYFDRRGPTGRQMMRGTASLQVTLESGTGADALRRWNVLHAIGPALVAAFANSPFASGRDTGWVSERQRIWWALDAPRTWAIPTVVPDLDPASALAEYALAAPVMVIPREGDSWVCDERFTFNDWIEAADGHRYGAPTRSDLEYHLTTLFPPVRPRGAVEVRYLDAQRANGWVIPLAVLFALVEHRDGGDEALLACADTERMWIEGARQGLADPTLLGAAQRLLDIAGNVLADQQQPSWIVDRVRAFAGEYTNRGRCPSHDLLDVGPGVAPTARSAIDEPIPVPVGTMR